ncbi:phosphatidate cytidylyltransferase [Piscinibacter sp.]|jgi:phosphatidate cytidylyltransferase|uniref:phosphatidate cytidylyltransferase n=1 Tax=Piscinibacter sp. TaxID=1903157 RepID=UPI00355A9D3D
MGALRDLTISQQVGLLFVGLFGLLIAVTFVAFWRTLRELTPEQQETHERFARDLRAIWLGAVLFWISWVLGAVAATLLFGVVSFVAFREFITLTHTRRADHRSLLLAFFLILPLQFVLAGGRRFDLFTVFIPVYVFFAIPVVSAFGNDPQRFLERTAKIQWGIMVCIYGMSHAPALLLIDLPAYAGRGAFLVFYLVAVVATAQIVQEAASRYLRRRPVARAISRSFSWRAWLIGALSAAFVGTLLYWATPFKPIPALVMGFIAGATGSLGEFVMKALKRDAGVRSWGGKASVTGAVGLLDRVAPLCFAAPVFFHAVRWYFGL